MIEVINECVYLNEKTKKICGKKATNELEKEFYCGLHYNKLTDKPCEAISDCKNKGTIKGENKNLYCKDHYKLHTYAVGLTCKAIDSNTNKQCTNLCNYKVHDFRVCEEHKDFYLLNEDKIDTYIHLAKIHMNTPSSPVDISEC